MTSLAPVLPKLCPLIRMLGSANDHEALAAARAISRTLKSIGGDFHDLVSILEKGREPDPRSGAEYEPGEPVWFTLSRDHKIRWLHLVADMADPGSWIEDFAFNVVDCLRSGRRLSAKQTNCAAELITKAWRRGERI